MGPLIPVCGGLIAKDKIKTSRNAESLLTRPSADLSQGERVE